MYFMIILQMLIKFLVIRLKTILQANDSESMTYIKTSSQFILVT